MPYKSKVKRRDSLPVREFYEAFKEELKLDIVAGESGLDKIIGERSVNRPALALVGHFKFFANKRLQLFGAGEMAYFKDLSAAEQKKVFREMAEHDIPCLIISRKTAPPPVMVKIADEFQIPLIRTPLGSKNFVTQATVLLEEMLAPRLSLHGTLLDIRGIGTLLRGKSGVGKS